MSALGHELSEELDMAFWQPLNKIANNRCGMVEDKLADALALHLKKNFSAEIRKFRIVIQGFDFE